MILLLGGTGYIGSAFARCLKERNWDFHAPTRAQVDYTNSAVLFEYLKTHRPEFLINAAGYTGKPNVDACETARADTLQGNTLFPQRIADICLALDIPWGHVSSGCFYSGAKISESGTVRAEKDLTKPHLRKLVEEKPESILGYTEEDTPNFSFRDGPCSFYSGTKALAEEAITGVGQNYIWRLRIPFDEYDNGRNYLSKVQRYAKVYENVNSISHRADFVNACLDLWKLKAPFGIYNVTNPGFIRTSEVVRMIEDILRPDRKFEFWASDEEFYKVAAKTPRSNCVMDTSKLIGAGVCIRSVHEALDHSLQNWKPETVRP
jgi:dTDP-4-dehydrorhamnose reductase